jgi:four helix bundle protein
MFGFEKLDVWQSAIDFADSIYRTTKNFPAEERFGLTSQVRRSSVSVAANIAEGNGRFSQKDYVRFLEISYGSLMETVSHLAVARRQIFLNEPRHAALYSDAERLARMLSGLRSSQLRRRGS